MPPKNKNACWIGFDLGGTKMLAKVFDNDFKELGARKKKTKANQGADAGLVRIIETIYDALNEAGVDPANLAGIGCGCPGPLDLDKGIILEAPNLGWNNFPLKKSLEKEFGCPAVIANDVDVGVYGEYCYGAAKKARTVLGVFPGTGIGGGCVYDGKLLRGRTGSCMEIGHVQVQPDGPLCGCGNRGCLEALASRLAIATAAAAAAFRGDAPHLLELAGTDISNIRSGTLAQSIQEGDTVVETIVRRAARLTGVAIGGAINLLAPDVVLLGGGLVEALPDLYLKEVQAGADANVMPSFRKTFKVVTAKLGDDAGVIGAAALAREMVEKT